MASIKFFQNAVSAFAGLTIAYWICILFGAAQHVGIMATLIAAGIFWLISSKMLSNQTIKYDKVFFILFILSIFLAVLTASLYAFNPDDSTFFHRIAFLRPHGGIFTPNYDTRIAFDQIAPISAAHLITSWEYFLSEIGYLLGSEVIGYQIGGSFVSIIFYVFSVNYTIAHFFPKSCASTRIIATASVVLFLFFDADQNRRIGAWLFLGGWTGKCFFAAALIALFPAFDRAYETNQSQDWFFVFCLIILFLGLTGSSLFILPIAIAGLIFSELIIRKDTPLRYWSFFLVALPIVVGGIFIYKFGGLKNDSYWRWWESLPFRDYARLTMSTKSFLLYLILIPILLIKNEKINKNAVRVFSLYQLILGIILLNPLLLPLFHRIIPSDGFWRIYYLFQYPTIVAILGMLLFDFLKIHQYKNALLLGTFWVICIVLGSSIFTLQKQWGYPHSFKRILQEKLPETEVISVKKALENCQNLKGVGVILAPEQWEVTAQMISPSLSSVSARHMKHNFLNTDTNQINLSEEIRLQAKDFVSGLETGSIEGFKIFIDKGVDIIALHSKVEIEASPMLVNYKRVSADENYVVFCRH